MIILVSFIFDFIKRVKITYKHKICIYNILISTHGMLQKTEQKINLDNKILFNKLQNLPIQTQINQS